MFDYDFSEDLRRDIEGLKRRNKPLFDAFKKKVREIVTRDASSVDYYKNLRAPLQDSKRVHIGSFVLVFRVYKERNLILFQRLAHHDEAYHF